jgi:hypothetical protein
MTVRPASAADAVAVRGSPRLSMTTVIGAPKASAALTLASCCSGVLPGSITALGMMSSDEPPE